MPRCNCIKYGGWDITSVPSCIDNSSHRGIKILSLFYLIRRIESYFLMSFCVYFRAMVEHTSLPPRPIHALAMVMPWLLVLGSHLRFIFFLLNPMGISISTFAFWASMVIIIFSLLQDLEFVQFHPTGIYGAGCLITEGWCFIYNL